MTDKERFHRGSTLHSYVDVIDVEQEHDKEVEEGTLDPTDNYVEGTTQKFLDDNPDKQSPHWNEAV